LEDYLVNYTESGGLRADSEARRNWNYECTLAGCGQRFNRPCRLEAHMRSHNRERPFACSAPGCDKTFPRKDHLQRHLKNAHSDPVIERTFTCDWQGCGKSFTSNGRLQRHKDAHESKFYCTGYPPCGEAFRKETTLEIHIKTQHLEVKPFPCSFVDPDSGERCTNAYQTDTALQRHCYKVHTKRQEEALFCMICADPGHAADFFHSETNEMITIPTQPPAFATHEELTAHHRECHPPQCIECGQRFKTDANLKSHMDIVHVDPAQQPQFPCPHADCDSIFNRKNNLAIHIQSVHDRQYKYLCTSDAHHGSKHDDLKAWNGENACGAAFRAKSSLEQHVRTHHLKLGTRKEFRKAAKSKKKPEASMLSMLTGVGYEKNREVPCLVAPCEYRFYMDRDLRRHLRAEHKVPEDEINDMIVERDALAGGQFWMGGLDEPMGLFDPGMFDPGVFDSGDPSMPQTPVTSMPMPYYNGEHSKTADPQPGFFDRFHPLLLGEEAQLDLAMGLEGLAPATQVQEGLLWDELSPVEHFSMDHIHG
jgi:general transcription factor IIIA